MINTIDNLKKQMFKLLALILFLIGVFSVNSTCELIFFQSEEPKSLKRFSKSENCK